MNDPEIILALREGAPEHEFLVAGHNDDFALKVDGQTLVGRVDPERGQAQAIAVEAPLELVDGALKVTGVPENVQELLDRIVDAIAGEPADGRTYGRKDREWQEAAAIVREHGGRTLDEPTLIAPQIVLGGGGDHHLTRNAIWTEGGWRYAFDGPAFVVSTTAAGLMQFNTAASGEAGAQITWGAAVQIGTGGGVTTAGSVSVGGGVSANGDISGHQVLSREWGSMGSIGLQTPLGGVHRYAFHWNGNAYIMVDNSTGWLLLTNQCDERLKQDIAPTRFDCLAAVEKIPLFEFRWRDNSTPGDIKPVESTSETLVPIGLVAQRIQEVAPSLIVKPPAPPSAASSAAPFNPMQIEPNAMFALLIGAIQQLTARVQQLEARA
jgi:Chaperone of endosialidase